MADINNQVLDLMPGERQIYVSTDSIVREAGADLDLNDAIPVEYLRSLNASGLPPGELALKPGCPLILLRNLTPARGLCNVTRLVLLRRHSHPLQNQGGLLSLSNVISFLSISHSPCLSTRPKVNPSPTSALTVKTCILTWSALCCSVACYVWSQCQDVVASG